MTQTWSSTRLPLAAGHILTPGNTLEASLRPCGHSVLVAVRMYVYISVYSCMKLKLLHPALRYSSPSDSL